MTQRQIETHQKQPLLRHREDIRRKAYKRETEIMLGVGNHNHFLATRRIYDSEIHPSDVHELGVIRYFQHTLDMVTAIERVVNRIGDVKFVQEPVPPATLTAYAVHIGVSSQSLLNWAIKYPEFDEALQRARDIQEVILFRMAALGAWTPSVSIFALKNLHGWTDKSEVRTTGTIQVVLDDQDLDA